MPINRDAAIAYTRQYWNRACEDELIGTQTDHDSVKARRAAMQAPAQEGWIPYFYFTPRGEEAFFARTEGGSLIRQPLPFLTNRRNDFEDCTHYVSSCLLKGGVPIKLTWGANDLVQSLLANKAARVLAEKTDRESGQKIVNSEVFKPGDMIGYMEGKDRYHHTAMFIGSENSDGDVNGGITCHSTCRFGGLTKAWSGYSGDAWYLDDTAGPYTLIHFTADDPKLSANAPYGWWQLGKNFYRISLDGTAKATQTSPHAESDRPHNSRADGHLFQTRSGFVMIWKQLDKSIAVETWSGVMSQKKSVVVRTEQGPMEANRVF